MEIKNQKLKIKIAESAKRPNLDNYYRSLMVAALMGRHIGLPLRTH